MTIEETRLHHNPLHHTQPRTRILSRSRIRDNERHCLQGVGRSKHSINIHTSSRRQPGRRLIPRIHPTEKETGKLEAWLEIPTNKPCQTAFTIRPLHWNDARQECSN